MKIIILIILIGLIFISGCVDEEKELIKEGTLRMEGAQVLKDKVINTLTQVCEKLNENETAYNCYCNGIFSTSFGTKINETNKNEILLGVEKSCFDSCVDYPRISFVREVKYCIEKN